MYVYYVAGAIGIGATIPKGQKGNGGGTIFASSGGHQAISLVNNTVADCDTWGIWISSSAGVVLRDNKIVRPWHHQTYATYPAPYPVPANTVVFLTESANFTMQGNCVLDPGPFVANFFNATATVSGLQPGSLQQLDWRCSASNAYQTYQTFQTYQT